MTGDIPIYLVDDDPSVLKSLAALLKSHGYRVETFASADQFLASYSARRPACLFLDIHMPGLSGLELQARLNALSSVLPIVFMTGHGDIRNAVRAMRAGAIDFIEKPCSQDAILAALRRAFDAIVKRDTMKLPQDIVRQRLERLTQREREVLDQLVQGETSKMIAHKLAISQRTVEIHRARVKEKMEARTLADLIRMMS